MHVTTGILECRITAVCLFVKVHAVPTWCQSFGFDAEKDTIRCWCYGHLTDRGSIWPFEGTGLRRRGSLRECGAGKQESGNHWNRPASHCVLLCRSGLNPERLSCPEAAKLMILRIVSQQKAARSNWRNREKLLAFFFALLAVIPVLAMSAQMPPILDRNLFFGEVQISGAQISPDGEWISFPETL
jgi:hypothetical protein